MSTAQFCVLRIRMSAFASGNIGQADPKRRTLVTSHLFSRCIECKKGPSP